jgi:hypothetical protein
MGLRPATRASCLPFKDIVVRDSYIPNQPIDRIKPEHVQADPIR